ncbi:dynein axonemal intermediate chain 7 [Aulostomus maculatus]
MYLYVFPCERKPPKKAKANKKGGKLAKKSKLQQEEEEDRLQREEEESRQRTERQEREQLEQEKKEQELERLELQDRERRPEELSELRHLLEENRTAVTKWKTDILNKAKWERYLRCDGKPDLTDQRNVNTYITLWRDDPAVDITAVLEKCGAALELLEELENQATDDPQVGPWYQEVHLNLQDLIHSKLLLSTEHMLKDASANMDIETGNMQTVVKDDNVTLCLWANLKKNPRFAVFSFAEAGVSFELPKQLAVSDIAVRSLHTRYDHLSPLAKMTHQRTGGHRSLAGGMEVDVPEQGTNKEGEVKDDITTQQQNADEEVKSIQVLEGKETISAASLQSTNSVEPEEGGESQIQTQMEALGAEIDSSPSPPPKAVDPVVDVMQYTAVGGVFYFDLFQLPPQPSHVNSWEIRQVLSTGLQVFQYPTEKSHSDVKAPSCPPVGVSVTLPDSVAFLETPQVARWDAAEKQWRMDGFTQVFYDEAAAKISLKMDSFHTFVLMQKTYANLPFRSWELRPLGPDSALLSFNGALMDLSIKIQGNQCMLQSVAHAGLRHLADTWMSAPTLQRAMRHAGVNVFVNEYTDQYVPSSGKDPLTEHAAYEQMALLASACAFSWSRWNSKCGSEHLIMQVCEHHGPDSVPEGRWSLYLLGAERSQKLEMTEVSESFSPTHSPGSEFHSTFIHMLRDDVSAEGLARTRTCNHLFADTVRSLLCATRPLSYS